MSTKRKASLDGEFRQGDGFVGNYINHYKQKY